MGVLASRPSIVGTPFRLTVDRNTVSSVGPTKRRWSCGDLVRPDLPSPTAIHHCDTVLRAQVARVAATGTTREQAQVVDVEPAVHLIRSGALRSLSAS